MKIAVKNSSTITGLIVSGTCPHCGRDVTFNKTEVTDLYVKERDQDEFGLGQRCCPNPECIGHVFFIMNVSERRVLKFYPAERIKFDSSNVPTVISDSMNEAIGCHAGENYRAAAVMVRRAIELLCDDQDANGSDLEKRINNLKDKVILPPRFFDGMHTLRMLGNDAVHVKAKVFDSIGESEVRTGIKFAMKLIENVYQVDDILSSLESLAKKH